MMGEHARELAFSAPLWMRDGVWRNVWVADRRNLTFSTGSDDGGIPSGWLSDIGTDAATPSNLVYRRNFNSVSEGYLDCGGGSNRIVEIDALATALSGSAKSFTMVVGFQIPAAPVADWTLCAFGRSATAIPTIGIAGQAGTTDCVVERRNDANNDVQGALMSPGTAPGVITFIYDGSGSGSITSRLNQTPVDTGLTANIGACTLDRFVLGCYNGPAASRFSNPYITHFFFQTAALSVAQVIPTESVIRKRNGF